ncbi:Uma2 family endonuclease [Thiorhodospira sibirica]|uniref:Uma2 family endonuclease n=1 Tax=Thiorhodospira sibirica TaxID=154347 RepID=UPI001C253B50
MIVSALSTSDDITRLRDKMQEYLANGARLGWLIDLTQQQVEVSHSSRLRCIVQGGCRKRSSCQRRCQARKSCRDLFCV